MTSAEILEKILSPIGLPIKPYEYRGTKSSYIVYNEEDERGVEYADDKPQGVSVWWQVHLFTDEADDFRGIKRQIVRVLLAEGFDVGAITTLQEKETKKMHVVITCQFIEDMED